MTKLLLPGTLILIALAAGCPVVLAADGPPGRADSTGTATVLKEQQLQKPLPLPGEVFEVEGCTAFVIQPAAGNHSANRPTPWVWYAPTLPGLPEARESWMFERFLAAGIAVAGVDVGESYGNPQGRARFTALYRELVERRGFSRKPCLLARSRGGLMLYNRAAEHPDSVGGIAGIYPVCNLRSWPGLAKASGAYGLSAAQLEEQLTQHNPIDRLAPLAKAGVPIFHIHGDSDKTVPLEANSAMLASRYRELGGSMRLRIPPGQGHNVWDVGVIHPIPEEPVPAGPAFLGPESLKAINHAIEQANRLGLHLGIIASSSWNAGGSWVQPRDAMKSIYQSETTVTGPAMLSQVLAFPASRAPKGVDGVPLYHKERAVPAFPQLADHVIRDAAAVIHPRNPVITWGLMETGA